MAVLAIGGVFFRAKDPKALGEWYQRHFGLVNGGPTPIEAGPFVFGTFPKDTDYFGGPQQFMLNLRVDDLEATMKGLAKAGIREVKPREDLDGIGKFAWVQDPEGNRVEIWQMIEAA